MTYHYIDANLIVPPCREKIHQKILRRKRLIFLGKFPVLSSINLNEKIHRQIILCVHFNIYRSSQISYSFSIAKTNFFCVLSDITDGKIN